MTTGIVTGWELGQNKNGTKIVVLLQVRITDKQDIQTVEYMNPAGEDSIPPVNSRVLILKVGHAWKIAIAASDSIDADMDEGEKKLYSQASGVITAFIKLLNTGIIELNGNADFAVRYNALNTALQAFITDLNTKLVTAFTGVGGTWPGTSMDISGAKVEEVKVI